MHNCYPEDINRYRHHACSKVHKYGIILKNPIPVHILYLTSWADDDGTAYFGKDIYKHHRQMIIALKQDHSGKTL